MLKLGQEQATNTALMATPLVAAVAANASLSATDILCNVTSVTCYADPDPGQGRVLEGNPFSRLHQMPAPASQEACAAICWQHKLPIAGVEYGNECYCGTGLVPSATVVKGCTIGCTGQRNGTERCGGMFQIGVFSFSCSGSLPPLPPFNNASLPLEQRLNDLMSRLSKTDLLAQLGGPNIGDIHRQNLSLPGASYGRECLSGVDGIKIPENKTGTSSFANPVNLGMTFDADLVGEVGSAIGDEARALWNAQLVGAGGLSAGTGGLLCLSPVLNVARDPRWGRSYESYGIRYDVKYIVN